MSRNLSSSPRLASHSWSCPSARRATSACSDAPTLPWVRSSSIRLRPGPRRPPPPLAPFAGRLAQVAPALPLRQQARRVRRRRQLVQGVEEHAVVAFPAEDLP